ncbi:fumarylacetoacetate hydrolase [Alicyclobacillus cellulosilyticus]|uniref:Fumarylacetoacetate hydrolase n=1 Tax=Alicyclobacillus cellulosilyticus TaxID=1003997 RepID=A0A917KJ89_9BACL|nr:fumarylacetoacetate hydrolase family protein [Alicyclobacillus cellulosilyticus]GGJ13903.1 fumarylacetoacetate hydrolase [Alicyclobacillus cellulosilyticus]
MKNVFCVGRNYREHAQELGNALPEAPLIFGKFTHAVVPAAGRVALPPGRGEIQHELELVLWFTAAHTPGRPFQMAAGGVALGLDLTDRAAQQQLKAAGQPWEFAKSFRGSAVITDVYAALDWERIAATPFELWVDGVRRQAGRAQEMVFSLQTLADHVAQHFGLAAGDLLFTGTPAGVGPLAPGQRVRMVFGGTEWGAFTLA